MEVLKNNDLGFVGEDEAKKEIEQMKEVPGTYRLDSETSLYGPICTGAYPAAQEEQNKRSKYL